MQHVGIQPYWIFLSGRRFVFLGEFMTAADIDMSEITNRFVRITHSLKTKRSREYPAKS